MERVKYLILLFLVLLVRGGSPAGSRLYASWWRRVRCAHSCGSDSWANALPPYPLPLLTSSLGPPPSKESDLSLLTGPCVSFTIRSCHQGTLFLPKVPTDPYLTLIGFILILITTLNIRLLESYLLFLPPLSWLFGQAYVLYLRVFAKHWCL